MTLRGPHEQCVADLAFPALVKLLRENATAAAARVQRNTRRKKNGTSMKGGR